MQTFFFASSDSQPDFTLLDHGERPPPCSTAGVLAQTDISHKIILSAPLSEAKEKRDISDSVLVRIHQRGSLCSRPAA